MKKSEVTMIQFVLKEKGKKVGGIDGKRGTKTDKAIQAYLKEMSANIDDENWMAWSAKRKAVACLQLLCAEKEIEVGTIDGLYGPQTEAASDILIQMNADRETPRGFGDIIPVRANPHNLPFEHTDDLVTYYGQPCDVRLVKIPCPWMLRLDWDVSVKTRNISIHEKLGDSLARILDKVYAHYGDDGVKRYGLDRYGGSYNCRKKRGSTSSWSTHAWGIAIDWFPSKNKLKWRSDRASLAHPDLDYWWECWEKEGWLSLGRSEDRDWMHVQGARR